MFFDTTVSSVKKTTRSYCDICEEFDKHETEDCPTQVRSFSLFLYKIYHDLFSLIFFYIFYKNDAGDNYAVKNTAPAWDDDDDETF